MSKVHHYLQIFIFFLVLSTVLIVSITSTFESYYSFYYENKNYEPSTLYKITDNIYSSSALHLFTTYTGLDTGYGFFAPNVASSFLFIFEIYDEKGDLVKIQQNIPLQSKEGFVRFTTMNSLYLDTLNENTTETYTKYLDLIGKQLTQYIYKQYPSSYTVQTNLYLYDFPQLKTLKGNKKPNHPSLIQIKEYSS